MRKRLTEAMIEKVNPPPSGRLEIFDDVVPSLALRVTAAGAKSFVVRARFGGRGTPTIRVTLGNALGMKLADAREEASRVLKDCRGGIDPRKARQAAKVEANTLVWERVVELFIEKHAKKHRTWRQSESIFRRRVTPKWRGKLLSEITRADVVKLLDGVERDSLYAANRALGQVRKLFNWAVLRGMVDASPIVKGMAREGEQTRSRFLSFEEIRVVWLASQRIGQPFGPFVRFLLATGQRRGETAGGRWAAMDRANGNLWTLEPEETKAGREHLVPLNELALAVLEEQPLIPDPSIKVPDGEVPPATYVFTTTGSSPLSGFSKAKRHLDAAVMDVLREEAEARGEDAAKVKPLPLWRVHDLRRTVATHMEDALGFPPHIVGSVLNHAPGGYKGVTAVYTRGDLIYERRRALTAWSRLLKVAIESGPAWAVISRTLRPETEAEAALKAEFRQMAQADEASWTAHLERITRPAEVARAA
jgi:integrase